MIERLYCSLLRNHDFDGKYSEIILFVFLEQNNNLLLVGFMFISSPTRSIVYGNSLTRFSTSVFLLIHNIFPWATVSHPKKLSHIISNSPRYSNSKLTQRFH
jgi:hypothetical protein